MNKDNLKNKNKREKIIVAILVIVGIIGIGYALLGANLQINGVADITATSWSVQFKTGSINVTEGSVPIEENTSQKAATIDSATQVSYQVKLPLPGDFYEFTVVAENTGSIDAMIDSISSKIKIGDGEEQEIITTGENRNLPAYLDYSVTYSDGIEIAPHHLLASNTEETFKIKLSFKTDIESTDLPSTAQSIGLNFQVNYVQKDSTAVIVPHPVSFADDDWDTIVAAVQAGNTSAYQVGDTKTVDMGTLGTHTLRVANNSIPAECSTTGFSQTACGFVLEFADIITTHRMNPYDNSGSVNGDGNKGGWEYSEMRTYVNSDIYNALPATLKNAIINTTVISGHGSNDSANFTTTDKLYLLSPHEVWEDVDGNTSDGIDYYDKSYASTRQLDYYKNNNITTSSYDSAIKKNGTSNSWWWLRSAFSNNDNIFFTVRTDGLWYTTSSYYTGGVSPAFRLG